MFMLTLGDDIIYKEKPYVVYNGVILDKWSLWPHPLGSTKGLVPRDECTKVYSLKGMIESYRKAVRFYNSSWRDIWVRELTE